MRAPYVATFDRDAGLRRYPLPSLPGTSLRERSSVITQRLHLCARGLFVVLTLTREIPSPATPSSQPESIQIMKSFAVSTRVALFC